MIMITPEEIAAIHRANATMGRGAALAEGRKRWPIFSEPSLGELIDRIIAMATDADDVADTIPVERKNQRR